MAVVDPFDGLGISAQHALVDRQCASGRFTKSGFDRMMTTLSQPCSKAWCTGDRINNTAVVVEMSVHIDRAAGQERRSPW